MSNQHIYTWKAGRFALPQFQMLGIFLIIYGGYMAFPLILMALFLLLFGFALET